MIDTKSKAYLGYTVRHGKVIPEGSVVVITAHDKGRKEYKVRNSAGKVKTYSYADFTLFTTVNPDVVVLHECTVLKLDSTGVVL